MPSYTHVTGQFSRIAASVVVAVLVCSCSSKKMSGAFDSPANSAPLPPSRSEAVDLATQDRDLLELAEGDPRARLIQSEAELTIEAVHQDSLHLRLVYQAELLGGYVVESTRQRTQVRVPAGDFKALFAEMETWGKVSRRVIKGADLTDSFRDLRMELDNIELRRSRLLQLLGQTDDVEAKLRIEAELERVSIQIDRLTATLAAARHELKFTTVTMETTKPNKDWKPGYVLEGLGLVFKGVRSLLVIR